MCMCVRVHVIDVEESKCPQVALKVVAAAADTVATAASFALEERSLIKIVEWFQWSLGCSFPPLSSSCRIDTLTLATVFIDWRRISRHLHDITCRNPRITASQNQLLYKSSTGTQLWTIRAIPAFIEFNMSLSPGPLSAVGHKALAKREIIENISCRAEPPSAHLPPIHRTQTQLNTHTHISSEDFSSYCEEQIEDFIASHQSPSRVSFWFSFGCVPQSSHDLL